MPNDLNPDQLRLLLDSYKEQISLNTKLLERQEQFLDSLAASTKELVNAITAQTAGLQNTYGVGVSRLAEKMTTEHGKIRLNIYVALVGMVSILTTLVALWVMK